MHLCLSNLVTLYLFLEFSSNSMQIPWKSWFSSPKFGTQRFIVRFPNSHGCELGERRVCTRGIFLQWPIVAKIFIESGQLRTELACSTRDLALSHWPNSQKCTGCGCRAVFLPSSSLPLALLRFATCIFRIFSTGFLSDSCSIFVSTVKLHASAFTSIPSHWKEHETWTALAILVIACLHFQLATSYSSDFPLVNQFSHILHNFGPWLLVRPRQALRQTDVM